MVFLLVSNSSQLPLKIVVKIQDVRTNHLRASSHTLVPMKQETNLGQKLKQSQKQSEIKETKQSKGLAKLLIPGNGAKNLMRNR